VIKSGATMTAATFIGVWPPSSILL